MNIVSLRMLNQQLLAPQFSKPEKVVSYFCAMQAQEYRMIRWAVAMRTKNPSLSAFQKAYNSGKIVRTHLMRGTWQLVAGEDLRWMLDLCAPKGIAVTKGWMNASKVSIPDEEFLDIREILGQTAADKGSVTKEDFVEALARKNIRMDDHRLSYHIRMSQYCGLLCSGDLLPMKATYSLVSQKLGNLVSLEREEALQRMASRYFRSRGAAALEDFVWWSGLNVGDCKLAISLIGSELHIENWQGKTYYISDACRTRGFRKGNLLLLPPYDEYLIAYKDRSSVLPLQHRHLAHNQRGIFYPIVLQNGVACGNWMPYQHKMQFSAFEEEFEIPDFSAVWQSYQQYLNS